VAERLRAHVASMAIPVSDHDESAGHITLTISVGVAALDAPDRELAALDDSRGELADLLAAADAALYHAKETGRNKTHVTPATAQAS
jgi:diguanylate cyclase (GGDEF)-like protein